MKIPTRTKGKKEIKSKNRSIQKNKKTKKVSKNMCFFDFTMNNMIYCKERRLQIYSLSRKSKI